jgi:hypothetical protein
MPGLFSDRPIRADHIFRSGHDVQPHNLDAHQSQVCKICRSFNIQGVAVPCISHSHAASGRTGLISKITGLVAMSSLMLTLPTVAALDSRGGCLACSTNPFEPFEFIISVAAFGLAFWMSLNPKLTRSAGRSIFQALRFRVIHPFAVPEGERI